MKTRALLVSCLVIYIALLIACSHTEPTPTNIFNGVVYNIFYEHWGFTGYDNTTLMVEDGMVSEHKDEWRRGFSEAIPTKPADELAKELGLKDSLELELTYGQLYDYKKFSMGEVYVFFGNYTGTDNYTIMIWDKSGLHTIEFADTNYFYRDLQLVDDHLYLILSKLFEDDTHNKLYEIIIYEIELSDYTYQQYTTDCEYEYLFACDDFAIKDRKLYMANTIIIDSDTANSIGQVIDLVTGEKQRIKRVGLSEVALLNISDTIAIMYGGFENGNSSFPLYIEYYDDQLDVIDARELSLDSDEYMVYLGDYLFHDGYMFCLLNNKFDSKCLLMIYDMNTDQVIHAQVIEPPVKQAMQKKTVFYFNDDGEYFNLQ